MKAFARIWDENQGWNKLGSDATVVIDFNGGTLVGFYRKIERELGNDFSYRVEIFHDNDKIYGTPNAVEYVVGGRVLSASERMDFLKS